MLPQLIVGLGLGLVIGSILGMAWCSNHAKFGTCDGALPHYTTWLAGALWVPVFLGLIVVWVGIALFYLRYGVLQ